MINFRPISVLHALANFFKKVIHEQMTECSNANVLFWSQQYRFLSNLSTEIVTLKLMYRNIENK